MPAALVRGAVDAQTAVDWLTAIDAHPAWVARSSDGFDPYSSSLQLSAIAGLDIAAITGAITPSDLRQMLRTDLGDPLAIGVDRCWVRRQYPPSRAPLHHAPHAWHQDGALCFDFLAAPGSAGPHALLRMATCWIALTPCGVDAPGLELIEPGFDRVLMLDELRDDAVRARHAASAVWRPCLQAGDALVFDGGVLHRTHAAPTMHADRTSIEIRIFDARRVDERLRSDRFVPFP